MKRELGFMDKTLALKLIDEVAKHPKTALAPQGFGESLLHPNYLEILEHARKKRVGRIIVISNGAKLSGEIAEEIIRSELLDDLYISLDGTKKETYEKLRKGASFEKVTENILNFINAREKSGKESPRVHLRIIRMKETEGEIEEFQSFWREKLGRNDEVEINDFNTWVGKVEDRNPAKRPRRKRLPCRQLWQTALIFWNGDLTPCCYDVNGELKVGNVKEASIRDIWSNQKLKALRDAHLSNDYTRIPLCKSCTEWF